MNDKYLKNKTVLIIDELLSEAKIISDILEEVGFKCIYAPDGEHGMELAHQLHPDVILIDWNMPGINKSELLEDLKTAKDTRIIPIILLTGSNLADAELCYALCDKADDYVRKPVDRFELLGRITANLRLYRVLNMVHERSERLAQMIYDIKVVQDKTEVL